MKNKSHLCFSIALALFSLIFNDLSAQSQENIGFTGRQFFALDVVNADSSSAWYQNIFNLKLLKELRPNNQIHIKITGNEQLMIEMIQNSNSKSLSDLAPEDTKSIHLRGIFKVGFYVTDINRTLNYFKDRGVKITHGIFKDDETRTFSFILEDPDGNLIHVSQAF